MATTALSKSAILSNVAKGDILGLDNDFTFTINDLLANDANSVKASSFYFGTAADQGSQAAYMAAHGIHDDGNGNYSLMTNAVDFQYTVRAGNNGAFSTADVDVQGHPVSHIGASLFNEDFNNHPLHLNTPDGAAGFGNLSTYTDIGDLDLNGWVNRETGLYLDENGQIVTATNTHFLEVQLVHDDVGVSSAPGTTDDHWMNFLFSNFGGKQAAKKGGTENSYDHIFHDSDGGTDQVSFDIANFNFVRQSHVGQDADGNLLGGPYFHYTTDPDDIFQFKIDGVTVYTTTGAQLHATAGDNTMLHVEFLANIGAPGDHTLSLVYTEDKAEAAPAATIQDGTDVHPYESAIGMGIDNIQIHNWIV